MTSSLQGSHRGSYAVNSFTAEAPEDSKSSCGCSDSIPCYFLMKYALFVVNFLVLAGGLCLIITGAWATSDKKILTSLDTLATDPAIFVITIGCVMVLISMFGCVGALRENLCLLKTFSVLIVIVFVMELTIGVLCFIFIDHVHKNLVKYMRRALENYMDDLDLKNTIDYIQRKFHCCGASSYVDWEVNIYFNCSSPARSACGVPMSCCLIPDNVQCGYDSRISGITSASTDIHTSGCISALIVVFKDSLFMIGLATFIVGFLEIFSILLAHSVMKNIIIARKEHARLAEPSSSAEQTELTVDVT